MVTLQIALVNRDRSNLLDNDGTLIKYRFFPIRRLSNKETFKNTFVHDYETYWPENKVSLIDLQMKQVIISLDGVH